MAELTTYEGLKAAVADWLGRDDLSAQIPSFIRLAEKRLERELRLRAMERRAVLDVAPGTRGVSLPDRRVDGDWDVFLEMRDLVWTDGSGIRDLNYVPVDEYQSLGAATGRPAAYTIVGADLFLLPRPATEGRLTLSYYAEIPPLSEAQPCNAILLAAPDVYLYAALAEAGPYTRGSAPAELWARACADAVAALEHSEQRARFTSNLSMRPARRI